MAKAIKRSLQPSLRAVYDDTGGIGKLYARQDEIGTPFCVRWITSRSKTKR